MSQTELSLKDRLIRAQVGGCTCGVMPPNIEAHDPMCRYRLMAEALAEIEHLEGIYLSAVNGRRDMRQALREARASSSNCGSSTHPCD